MLDDFIKSLETHYPEARLDLTKPAAGMSEVRARLDHLCMDYAAVSGSLQELDEQESYMRYTSELATTLDIEPEKMRRAVEVGITAAIVGGSTIAVLLADGTSHAAHAGDVAADIATHGVDWTEAGMTLGVSILLSLGAGLLFRRLNEAKRAEVERLLEKAMLNARLARTLMIPGKVELTTEVLMRIRGCSSESEGT